MTVPLGNPYSLGNTGVQTSARTDRLALGASFRPGAAALSAAGGMLHGPAGTRGDLTLLTDVLLRVDPFLAVVQGTHNTQQGQYLVPNGSTRDLAVPAKDASLFRRALVQVRVADSLEAGVASSAATDGSWLEISSGALAASNPALPATPANALLLGELSIPSIASGQPVTLTRYYPRTITRGGVLPFPTEAAILALPAGLLWAGMQAYAEDTGANATYEGARWVFYDTKWQTYTPSFESGVPMVALGNGVLTGRYYRKGREVSVEFLFRVGTAGTNIGAGVIRIGYPTGYRPIVTLGDPAYGTYCGAGRAVGASGNIVCTVVADAPSRKLVLVNAADTVIQAGGGPTSIAAANTFVQGRCSYLTDFEA